MRLVIIGALLILLMNNSECIDKTKDTFIDGVYEDESRSIYTHEPFWGQIKIKILKNKIIDMDFKIIDKSRNEVFDQNYERHYIDNELYIEQCRNDLRGIHIYRRIHEETRY